MAETREAILKSARLMAQAHGYGGLNFRDLAADVGIRSASLYYHFDSKAELGAAVAKRYWEDTAVRLATFRSKYPDACECLSHYPDLFRTALANQNRMCLAGFMSAEADDLPPIVQTEVRRFAETHLEWLGTLLAEIMGDAGEVTRQRRAMAIFAAVNGAQLTAHGRGDLELYDKIVEGYREIGLFPYPVD